MKSREEIRFLALLHKSQEKAALLKTSESDKNNAIIEDEWRVPKVKNVEFQCHFFTILFGFILVCRNSRRLACFLGNSSTRSNERSLNRVQIQSGLPQKSA